jgi:hypothetical protein
MASNNFQIFNETFQNALNDNDYTNHAQRSNGLTSGQAQTNLHNKMFRQWSMFPHALGEYMKNQGLTVSDTDAETLITAVSNFVMRTNTDIFEADGTTVKNATNATNSETAANIVSSQNQDIGDYNFRAKTLQSDVATGTAPLVVASTTKVVNLNADTIDGVHKKIINIGDWNMDTTSQVNVSHGLSVSKIISINVTIISDNGVLYPVSCSVDGSYYSYPIGIAVGASALLQRTTGSYFDSPLFDSTSFNRGFIIIEYVD